jgi:hypothetical protein
MHVSARSQKAWTCKVIALLLQPDALNAASDWLIAILCCCERMQWGTWMHRERMF